MGFTAKQKKLADKCTRLQRDAVINRVLKKMSAHESYVAAGGTAVEKRTQEIAAWRVLASVSAKAFMASLEDFEINKLIMTRERALERLTELAENKIEDVDTLGADVRGAIKNLSEMQGWEAPKVTHTSVTKIERKIIE